MNYNLWMWCVSVLIMLGIALYTKISGDLSFLGYSVVFGVLAVMSRINDLRCGKK